MCCWLVQPRLPEQPCSDATEQQLHPVPAIANTHVGPQQSKPTDQESGAIEQLAFCLNSTDCLSHAPPASPAAAPAAHPACCCAGCTHAAAAVGMALVEGPCKPRNQHQSWHNMSRLLHCWLRSLPVISSPGSLMPAVFKCVAHGAVAPPQQVVQVRWRGGPGTTAHAAARHSLRLR